MKFEQLIKKTIFESLAEADGHSAGHSKVRADAALRRSPGSFNFPRDSRAKSEAGAKNLLQSIGISKPVDGSNDYEKLKSFLALSLKNSTFSNAYNLSSSSREVKFVFESKIATHYGIKFMELLLAAGINSGYLKLNDPLKLEFINDNKFMVLKA